MDKRLVFIPSIKGLECPDTVRLLACLLLGQAYATMVPAGSEEAEALWLQTGVAVADRRHPLLCVCEGDKVLYHMMEPKWEEIADAIDTVFGVNRSINLIEFANAKARQSLLLKARNYPVAKAA